MKWLKTQLALCGIAAYLSLHSAALHAQEEQPTIELGVGLAMQSLPDYRGSKEQQLNGLPFPYIVYRGAFIELDRDSAKGKLFTSDAWELNISADASYTEDTRNNSLRAGMEPINPTFELGPSLEINLSGADLDQGWSLRLPVRAVFAVDLPDVEKIGWLANPKLTLRRPEFYQGANLKLDMGFVFGDSDYHNYLYGVSVADATATRPAFEASAGYSGAFIKVGLDKRAGAWWLKSYIRYDNLTGVDFADSSLFETDHYLVFGLAVARVLWEK